MNKIFSFSLLQVVLFSTCVIFIHSCKPEDDDNEPKYEIPTTYNFSNVNYTGQTQRLDMLGEMTSYMKTANTPGTTLDAQKLKDMFANTNNQFTGTGLNDSGKQLKNKCFAPDVALFESYFDAIALASQSTVAGSNGVSGVVTSTTDPSKKYLFNENGFEYTQLIEKGLMGAVFYYQAVSVYLSDDKVGDAVDNTTVTPGQGTPMEHHWDEAFGYFGVPIDFPANTTGIRYWGKYCNDRNGLLNTNAVIMNAFIKGRAAISNKDMATKNEQIPLIRDNWEKVSVATAIHYLNDAKAAIADDAIRNHALSEAVAFIKALKYNPTKKITDAQIDEALGYIGSNLYNVTLSNLDNARNLLSGIYGMNNIKDSL